MKPPKRRCPVLPATGHCRKHVSTHAYTHTHTHTHTAGDIGEEHARKEEQPLLPAVLLQNIIFTIKEKFSTGSAPLSQMSNKWI